MPHDFTRHAADYAERCFFITRCAMAQPKSAATALDALLIQLFSPLELIFRRAIRLFFVIFIIAP